MGRTKTVSDDAVLAAVGAEISAVGPAALTLASVGERVGLSAATIVQRFGSRRALLLAWAQRGEGHYDAVFARARARREPRSALIKALTDLAGTVTTPEAMANNLAMLQIDVEDPEFRALAAAGMQRLRELIAELLEEAGSQTSADTVLAVYNGTLITWALLQQGSLERRLRAQLDAVIN